MKLQRSLWEYKRKDVANAKDNYIYVFTDNGDRTSGSCKIPDDSSYSLRFGKKSLCYPRTTTAVLRGLEKAFPVTTQKRYVKGAARFDGNWVEEDFEEFKKVIDADFEEIKKACVKYKPLAVVFPCNGVLGGNISRLTITRVPKLYSYIVEKEIELKNFDINNLTKEEIEKYECN